MAMNKPVYKYIGRSDRSFKVDEKNGLTTLIDRNDIIKLQDRQGEIIYLRKGAVKRALADGKVEIIGLKLSADNRLLTVDIDKQTVNKLMKSPVIITREMIRRYNLKLFNTPGMDLKFAVVKSLDDFRVRYRSINNDLEDNKLVDISESLIVMIKPNKKEIAFVTDTSFELDNSIKSDNTITEYEGIFECTNFGSINLSNVRLSNVTNANRLFYSCKANQIILGKGFLDNKITDMSYMFAYVKLGRLDLSNLGTRCLENASSMFEYAEVENLEGLHIDRACNIKGTFRGLKSNSDIDLGDMDVKSLISVEGLFSESHLRHVRLPKLSKSSIGSIQDMFSYAYIKEIKDIDELSGENIVNYSGLFNGSNIDSLYLGNFDFSHGIRFRKMFYDAKIGRLVLPDKVVFSDAYSINIDNMFCGANIGDFDLSKIEFGRIEDIRGIFKDFKGILYNFKDCNMNNIRNACGAFLGCKIDCVDLDIFSENLCDATSMFENAVINKIIADGVDFKALLYADKMFKNCEFKGKVSMKLSNGDYGSIMSTSEMFWGVHINDLDLSELTFRVISNTRFMFREANIDNLIFKKEMTNDYLDNMSGMFAGFTTSGDIDISGIHTKGLKYVKGLFYKCNARVIKLCDFSINNICSKEDMSNMYTGCTAKIYGNKYFKCKYNI